MGKSTQTQMIVSLSTILMNNLLEWIEELPESAKGRSARKIWSQRVSDGDYQELSNKASSRAGEHFLEQFGYAYNGARSVPPQALPGSKIGFTEEFWSAEANNLPAIQAGVNTAMADANAPAWAQAKITNDILGSIDAYVAYLPTNNFLAKAFTQLYPYPNDTSLSLQCDTCWIYCTTMAPDPGNVSNQVNTLFLYSIGVCYMSQSWPNRLQAPNPQIPVVRIAFAFSQMAVGIAVAAFIWSAKDKPSNVNATISYLGLSASLVISTTQPPPIDPGTGQPDIPYQWALSKILSAQQDDPDTISDVTVKGFGIATADEVTEIGYLNRWENSNSKS